MQNNKIKLTDANANMVLKLANGKYVVLDSCGNQTNEIGIPVYYPWDTECEIVKVPPIMERIEYSPKIVWSGNSPRLGKPRYLILTTLYGVSSGYRYKINISDYKIEIFFCYMSTDQRVGYSFIKWFNRGKICDYINRADRLYLIYENINDPKMFVWTKNQLAIIKNQD